jgi:hypothetical protein
MPPWEIINKENKSEKTGCVSIETGTILKKIKKKEKNK